MGLRPFVRSYFDKSNQKVWTISVKTQIAYTVDIFSATDAIDKATESILSTPDFYIRLSN